MLSITLLSFRAKYILLLSLCPSTSKSCAIGSRMSSSTNDAEESLGGTNCFQINVIDDIDPKNRVYTLLDRVDEFSHWGCIVQGVWKIQVQFFVLIFVFSFTEKTA
jgi:hypothetical protein